MGTDCGISEDFFGARMWSVAIVSSNTPFNHGIVQSDTAVALIGAGAVLPQDIDAITEIAPILVAADGGAGSALAHGHIPDLVIGDLDSLPEIATEKLSSEKLIHIGEQDTTDFEKCLARIDAPLILALGFTGLRLDHELAVMSALVRHPEKRCLLVGSHDVVFHAPRALTLDLEIGSRLSLFPMAVLHGQSEGLQWPIDGIRFAPDGRVGTSNAVTGPVRLTFDGNGMLVLLPRVSLTAAMAALQPG